MEQDTAVKLAELDARSKSNTHRIDALERDQESLKSLTTSVAVMAEKIGTVETNVSDIKQSVDALKAAPGKKWESFAEKVLWLVIGGIIAAALANIGIT